MTDWIRREDRLPPDDGNLYEFYCPPDDYLGSTIKIVSSHLRRSIPTWWTHWRPHNPPPKTVMVRLSEDVVRAWAEYSSEGYGVPYARAVKETEKACRMALGLEVEEKWTA